MNRRSRLLLVILLFAVAASPPFFVRAADGDRSAAIPSIADLIADLDSNQYAVRKRATRNLVAAGKKSVAPLLDAIQTGPPEVRIRGIRILQEFYATTNGNEKLEATIDAAEIALETLAESENRALAASAERVLNSFYDRREKRALAHIERLGGLINYRDLTDPRFNRMVVDPTKKQIAYILLGSGWKGGDAGLKYVKRLSQLKVLYLSGTGEAAPISKVAEQSLQATLPNLMIQLRGKAYLGIGGGVHPRGCLVLQVKAGAAAAKAGLREFDVITEFGGKNIPDFDTLILHIKNFAPGDKVKVKVIRGADELVLNVVMGVWK